MAKLRLEVVTPERLVYSGDVDVVLAPGLDGQLGILPHHAPLLALLEPGELRARVGEEEVCLAIGGGFLEVLSNQVTVFADVAELAEEIDIARAEAARKRAEDALKRRVDMVEFVRAEAALRRAVARLQVAKHRRRRRGRSRRMSSQGGTETS